MAPNQLLSGTGVVPNQLSSSGPGVVPNQLPSGAGVEVLTTHNGSRPHTPHGELEFSTEKSVEELSKQLERERCVLQTTDVFCSRLSS